jgi:hypothetical protein
MWSRRYRSLGKGIHYLPCHDATACSSTPSLTKRSIFSTPRVGYRVGTLAHRSFKGYTEPEIPAEHFSRFYTPEDLAARIPVKALSTAATAGRFEAKGWRVRKVG